MEMSYALQRNIRSGIDNCTLSGELADAFAGKPAPTDIGRVATIVFTPFDL